MRATLCTLVIVLLAPLAFSQQAPVGQAAGPLMIGNFVGMANAKNPFTMEPNEALRALNVDFASKGDRVIAKRRGCDSVAVFSGIDSVVELFADYDRQRNRRLVGVVAPKTKGWGAIYETKVGIDKFANDTAYTRKIFDHWPITEATSITRFNNLLYFANGSSKGMTWDGRRMRSYPLRAPGEPTFVPLTKPGGLRGTYYYTFVWARFSGNPDPYGNGINWSTTGYICGPIEAQNQAVMIKDMPWVQADSVSRAIGVGDSLYIGVLRSRGDVAAIDQNDSMWFIGATILHTTPAALYADSIIDTISDAYMTAHYSYRKAYQPQWIGREADGSISGYRYGSPLFDSAEAGMDTNSVYYGAPWSGGIAYAYTKYDTLRRLESEISEPLVIREHVPEKAYAISFPPLSPADSGCVYNIYRAYLGVVTSDTTSIYIGDRYRVPIVYTRGWNDDGTPIYDTAWKIVAVPPGTTPNECNYGTVACQYLGKQFEDRVFIDSVSLGRYWKIGAVKPTHTDGKSFFDFANADSVQRKIAIPYQINAIPPIVDKFFAYGQTLYAQYQNRIYYSIAGDPSRFNGFDVIPIGEYDGDPVSAAWATQDAVRIGKPNAIWNIPKGNQKPEIGSYTGVIAPRGYVRTPYGDYYMSRRGLERETQGQYLESRYTTELVSSPIDNIKNLSLNLRRGTRLAAVPSKELVLACIGDSSYVYQERINAWSVWTMKFGPWCLYDTTSFSSSAAGEIFYFVPPHDSVLYRWAGRPVSIGVEVDPHNELFEFGYESGPLFKDDWKWQIEAAQVWADGAVNGDDIYVGFKDILDSSLGRAMAPGQNDTVMIFNHLGERVELKEKVFVPSQYVRMVLRSYGLNFNFGAIQRIDLWASRRDKVR